ncbi:Protein SSUH2 -like protein [Halotydeus destructor]|nr:Protein SSUH2 -like protein [Halotydeus destructor]
MAEKEAENSKLKEAEAYSSDTGFAAEASAPPVDGDDDLPPPYDFTSPPPSSNDFKHTGPVKTFDIPVTRTTEKEVRSALQQFADKKTFFSEKLLADGVIQDIVDVNVFQYKLDTMYEKRAIVAATVPWHGEEIDGPFNGPSPDPWDIPVFPAEPFKSAEVRSEVPHTAHTQTCFKCQGEGRVRCSFCDGFAIRDRRPCVGCSGSGMRQCETCKGRRQLKHFTQLVVVFTSRTLESIDNPTDLSERKVKKADGHLVVDERAQRVSQLPNFPSTVISETCAQLIDMSLNQFPGERIDDQRQTVKLVPVANVEYKLGKKGGSFRIYGLDRRIKFSDYPSSCCIL